MSCPRSSIIKRKEECVSEDLKFVIWGYTHMQVTLLGQ